MNNMGIDYKIRKLKTIRELYRNSVPLPAK